MSGIVCAIRGGPGSNPTIDKSIELAKETGLTIHFLYVSNLDFLSHTSTSRVSHLYEDIDQMGEFILLMAQERADSKGVSADGTVRHGHVQEEIIHLCHDLEADYVVLGRPQMKEDVNVFTHDLLNEFEKQVQEESGAKVILAGDIEGE